MASWKSNNKVAIGAVGVIVLSLGLIIFQIVRYSGSGAHNISYARPVWCDECDRGGVINVEGSTEFPQECPLCGKKSAYPVYYCSECDDFFMEKVEFIEMETHVPECPYCGIQDPNIITPINSVTEIQRLGFDEYFDIPPEFEPVEEMPR